MKKIYKLFSFLAVAALIFSSCEEEIVRDPSPEVKAGNQNVYFNPDNQKVYELDPAQATAVKLKMHRADSTLAAEVPLTVLRNDSNIFVFPASASFAAGQGTTEITVNFPEALEGVPYTFEVQVAGDDYLNPYATTIPSAMVTITRVYWENLGAGQFKDAWTLYSVADITIYYSALKKMYRFANPYSVALLTEAEWDNWIGGPTTEWITFEITATKNLKWDFWYLGLNYQGTAGQPIKAYMPSKLAASQAPNDLLSIVDPLNNKLLHFFPYIYIDGVGGYGLKEVLVSLPGGPDLKQ